MTPDERMELYGMIEDYREAYGVQGTIAVLYKISAFVESLERDAYNVGFLDATNMDSNQYGDTL